MIGTIFVTIVLGAPLCILLRRQCTRICACVGQMLWGLVAVGAVAGGGLGILLNRCEFPIGGHLRVAGFPIPGVFFHLVKT